MTLIARNEKRQVDCSVLLDIASPPAPEAARRSELLFFVRSCEEWLALRNNS
ncbi:MAG: hypothetical protein IID35_09925 [Planctomycetes bacterium]|nr:hypothetical protein [Planctomycetota bacterium]